MDEQSAGITPEEQLLGAIFGEKVKPPESQTKSKILVARIAMASEPTLGEVIEFLQNVRSAYVAIDTFMTRTIPPTYDPSQKSAHSWLGKEIYPSQDIILARASFSSPGFWEFFGNLNPLKVICDYLQQRHERMKDLEYRNEAEKERLALENVILLNKALKGRIELLREVGTPDEQIQQDLLVCVASPLEKLGRQVDLLLIGEAGIGLFLREKSA